MPRVPASIKRFARVFSQAGYELYLVGGAVRDALLGSSLQDFDFATSATPEEVKRLFRRVIPTGIRHGTVTVLFENQHLEVTTYRVEGPYTDKRHPDSVTYTRSLRQDLERRDFTINAIALDPLTEKILDPLDGRRDLKGRVIRTVGCARDRFSEDALRIIRAVRFYCVLEFSLDPPLLDAMRDSGHLVDHVAPERIATELEKMMGARLPSRGWVILRDTGILSRLVPELLEDRASSLDIFSHLVKSCDCAPRNQPVLRWAALLHDAGKPRCLGEDARGIHFHGHDEESARMAEEVLSRFRFPNERIRAVSHLVRHHMTGYNSDWSDSAVRRLVSRVGSEEIFLLITLQRADLCGKTGHVTPSPSLDELDSRVRTILSQSPALTRAELAVGGSDIMTELGLSPGPLVGIILDELLQTVIDDPQKNHRDTLLKIARRFRDQRLSL